MLFCINKTQIWGRKKINHFFVANLFLCSIITLENITPSENVKLYFHSLNHQMQFICVVTSSYNLVFLETKNPWLVFWIKNKISKQRFVENRTYRKIHIVQFYSIEKMLILLFSYTYFCSMKLHEKSWHYFFHIWKLYGKHFCQPGNIDLPVGVCSNPPYPYFNTNKLEGL